MADARDRHVVARWLLASEWHASPGYLLCALMTIALGVSLGFAVHLVNASALGEFDKAMHTVNGAPDFAVRSTTPLGFDERLYPRVARLPGLSVLPVIVLEARLNGTTPVSLEGIDLLRAAPWGETAMTGPDDRLESALRDGATYLAADVLHKAGVRTGDTVTLSANGKVLRVRIAGTLPPGNPAAVMDIAVAQGRLGTLGRLQRLDIRCAPGVTPAQGMHQVRAILPADALVVDAAADRARHNGLSAAYRVNLDMLALMALLTGGFLVYADQSLSFTRRRPQFILLRVLGMSRHALLSLILGEALALGVLGATTGLLLGQGLASLALTQLGGDLTGGYFQARTATLIDAPWSALGFGLLGVSAALLGSVTSAHAAARLSPGVVIKRAGDLVDPRRLARPWPSVALLIGALVVSQGPPVDDMALFGYLAMAMLLAGGVMLMPWLARTLAALCQPIARRSTAFHLANARLAGAPTQASRALAGMLTATALTVAMAVMTSSFRGSVERWLGDLLQTDLYLVADDEHSGGFDPTTRSQVQSAPGVARVGALTEMPLQIDARRPSVTLVARTLTGPARHQLSLLGPSATPPPGTLPVWISEPASRVYAWHTGDTLQLPLPGAPRVHVAGVWRDYARPQGAIMLDEGAYTQLTHDRRRTRLSVWVTPDTNANTVAHRLETLLRTTHVAATIIRPQAIRRQALQVFDRSFLISRVLEAIALGVGLAGVASTLSAQILSRTGEFGVLRHLGASHRTLIGVLLIEGSLLGLLGTVAGSGLGLIMSQVLIHVINPQSFHWTMETLLPWSALIAAGFALVTTTALITLVVGRRILSSDAVRAVKAEAS